jgi:hypothetical protein
MNIVLTDEHKYFVDGKNFDGVTNIIQLEGGMPGMEFVDPWYAERGKMIHLATALYDMGTLDESTVDPRISGYLESWKIFKAQNGITYSLEQIEVKMVDTLYRYAGTIDRLPLLDIKAGIYKKADLAQLGGYFGLCQSMKIDRLWYMGAYARQIVYLDENGEPPCVDSYTISQAQSARDSFLCALNWHRFKNSK